MRRYWSFSIDIKLLGSYWISIMNIKLVRSWWPFIINHKLTRIIWCNHVHILKILLFFRLFNLIESILFVTNHKLIWSNRSLINVKITLRVFIYHKLIRFSSNSSFIYFKTVWRLRIFIYLELWFTFQLTLLLFICINKIIYWNKLWFL